MYHPPTHEELSSEFHEMEDWDERYEYLVELGRELPPLPPNQQTEKHLVKGCMSTVWLIVERLPDQKVSIAADSDSLIVKGLVAILLSFYNQKNAQAILESNPETWFDELGLNAHLSPQRRNGLYSMVKRVRELAAESLVEQSTPQTPKHKKSTP